ncbi:topology modulation protein [Falsibacillus pallidus]|uniref:Adenylate kinase family enzyme n=1 Tax=Falsibacillus pallidus TaxID=493781 RepID=A0A370GNX8_9BACI|nr:topology modulation protein [Falsibacillus pallidus]RDI45435.1 adenylate kinase family enzyme [Falsibacillus pallidus]
MKKIMVVGISAGVGKSTFAKKIGDLLDIPVHHLDRHFWKPGWAQATFEEFRGAQEEILEHDRWIIEGNYTATYDMRAEQADTIIYLELPRYVCIYRVFKRFFKNIGRTRPDLGPDCKEKIDWPFLKFIWTTYYPRKAQMQKRFTAFQSLGKDKTIVELKNKKEIADYLQSLEKNIK